MTTLLYALAVLVVLDSLRLRARCLAVATLSPSDAPVDARHRFLLGHGVSLTDATRRAASAHATARGLQVVDLWPVGLPAELCLGLLALIDIPKVRKTRLARGLTAGQAMLVDADVLRRAGLPDADHQTDDPVEFFQRAVTLKRHASATFDFAIAPGQQVAPDLPERRLALARAAMGELTPIAYGVRVGWLAFIFAGAAFDPEAAGALLGTWMIRPVLVLAATPLQSPAVFLYSALRPLFEVYGWLRTFAGRWRSPTVVDPRATVESLRPVYAELLREGTAPFFEARQTTCPMCHGTALESHLEVGDLFQAKPGRFRLDRCETCRHIFQNPRLTPRGLDFYYRDFYDGLGAEALDAVLWAGPKVYETRARMVGTAVQDGPRAAGGAFAPANWLDVGGGSGHFCVVSRDVFPECRFEALDLSAGVDEAVARGWIDGAHRGLFPALAPAMTTRYDVVSMSHYLEHTVDPRAELAAAHGVLADGGLLFIELPDPESVFGRVLGRFWLPWFQPQHLHFLSAGRLEGLLGEAGFEPLTWHRGECHHSLDFFLATTLFLNRVLPKPARPWLPPPGLMSRFGFRAGFTLGLGLLAIALVVDAVLMPFSRRPGAANAFRVVARKKKSGDGRQATAGSKALE